MIMMSPNLTVVWNPEKSISIPGTRDHSRSLDSTIGPVKQKTKESIKKFEEPHNKHGKSL